VTAPDPPQHRPKPFARKFRPGFMGMTIGLALVVTPAIGLLAEHLDDPAAVREAQAEEADQDARDAMLKRGWAPFPDQGPGADSAAHLLKSRDVELLHATKSFRLDLGGGPLHGRAASAADSARAARVVAAELRRYPRAFLGASRFRRVLLCSGLAEGKTDIPSLPNYEHTLLLDIDAKPFELRRLLDHELFHFADYADDNDVQHDPAWDKLNDHWFTYGDGGRFMRDPDSAKLTTKLPGFVTRYATSALEEDKAETFAFMMVAPQKVVAMASRDPILKKKILAVERQLARLSPSIDARFWAAQGLSGVR
jgi:hypothetical protein